MPRSVLNSSAKVTSELAWRMRRSLALPWPSGSGVPEPFDLKWLTITAKASASGLPTALKAWASGSRASANASVPVDSSASTTEPPTSATAAGL